jgi:lactate 2-monooxygenase
MVVTLDTFTLAWRPTDLNHSYLSFLLGDGCQIGHSDPVFDEKYAVLDTSLRLSQWGIDED